LGDGQHKPENRVVSYPLETVDTPDGLLVKALQDKDNQNVVVHFLNCAGEKRVDFGEMIVHDASLPFPELEKDLTLNLHIESVAKAYLFSPDWKMRVAS
jgi:uncharacterized protein YutE (UPF0331/DUF86 family)